MSPRLRASKPSRASSTRTGVVASSGISLCSFLGKPLGGCTGLVDVEVADGMDYQALLPQVCPSVSHLDVALDAERTGLLEEDSEGDAVAEIGNLLHLE